VSIAVTYHQATKYHPETIGQHAGLDWDQQPLAYKEYDCPAPVALAGFLPFDPNPFTGQPATLEAKLANDGEPSLAALSRLMFFSYGITGVVAAQPRPLFLRAAPSAGGLYPAELYVVSRSWPGLPPGLYGYDPRHHHLVPLWPGEDVADALGSACYDHAAVRAAPACLITTGVFRRSSWRYGERAYRRVLLDSGHLLANATLAASALGLRTALTAAFCDERLNTLLRVDGDEEGALAVVALNRTGPSERPSWSALPSAVVHETTGEATEVEPPLLNALHHASVLPSERPVLIARGEDQADDLENRYGLRGGEPLAIPAKRSRLSDDPLAVILHRRSTRRFRRSTIAREQLARILAYAHDPAAMGLGEQPSLDRGLLMTFVAAMAVDGLANGVYYYAPHSHELRLLKTDCAREAVQFLCLGQELGGDAAVVVFHTADLSRAVRRQGDRAYRYLHLDAGMLGERLDLAALAEDLGASGIGGFFDDHVTDLLGIPKEQAVVYITTIGVPAQAPTQDE
jgi:SagB-type dehydrogenase family enzyme